MEFAFPREFSGQEFLRQKNHYWPEGDMERNVISHPECYYVDDSCIARSKHKTDWAILFAQSY